MLDQLQLQSTLLTWNGENVTLTYNKKLPLKDFPALGLLRHRIKTLTIPINALSDIEIERPRRNWLGAIRLLPRAGASSLHTAAGAGLPPPLEPLVVAFPKKQELLAEYYAEEIKQAITTQEINENPPSSFLIRLSSATEALRADDCLARLESDAVIFEWSRNAHPIKRSQGAYWRVPLTAISSVQWRFAEQTADRLGFVRLKLNGVDDAVEPHPGIDINTALLSTVEQYVDGLLFAATLLERVSATSSSTRLELIETWMRLYCPDHHDPARHGKDPLVLLREIAALRDSGVLTEEEFQAKKAQLLDRL